MSVGTGRGMITGGIGSRASRAARERSGRRPEVLVFTSRATTRDSSTLLTRDGRAAEATLARGLTGRAGFVGTAAADRAADLTAAGGRFDAGAGDDFFTAFLATEAVTPFAPNVLLGLDLPLI